MVMSTISEQERPEHPLDRSRRECEEPRPRECKLDTTQPTLDDIEERVAAEHNRMIDILAEVLGHFQSDPEMRGPPGPTGPRGEKDRLASCRSSSCGHQRRSTMRATSSPTTAARSRRGATPGSRRRMPTGSASPLLAATARASPCAARSTRPQNIVGFNGGSFVALKDKPGPGWQLIASQGKRGVAGEKGERGPPGPKGDAGASGATIRDWKIDRARYVATPIMSDGGDGPPLELRGLFEQFFLEAR